MAIFVWGWLEWVLTCVAFLQNDDFPELHLIYMVFVCLQLINLNDPQVEKFLEKKLVQWTEDEANPGTILIRINQVKDQQSIG